MSQTNMAIEYARANRERFLGELEEFVSIPSISTLSEHKGDMERAAEWVAHQMRAVGLENVSILPTAGHPVAYGEWLHADGKPTILVYGHYDVQPVDPLDEWVTPPVTATIQGDNMYGRGASDMKGNAHETLKALEALKQTGGIPLNVKLMFEGEEEIGSKNLGAFIDQHAALLQADFCVNADSGILAPDLPAIVAGLRGLAYFELWVYGPGQDLHSGTFGGSIANPAQVLCELIAGMHDAHGRVTLPGFYDKVRALTPQDRADYARVPVNDEIWKEMTGVTELYGEEGFTTQERTGGRPTLEINGILSGFTGEGAKTVLPAKAMAKISTRLVPFQDDTAIEGMLRQYVREHAPSTVRCQIKRVTATAPGVLLDRESIGARAATAALRDTFGRDPIFICSGGSVPVVTMIQQKLGMETVMLGFGLPDDKIHGPNEKLHLPNYYHGIEAFIRFFQNVALP
ncbi:MAG: dipeptidase [Anaerolineae bacterium]|nr:dipeptidase [Anaerolineae bacterium]